MKICREKYYYREVREDIESLVNVDGSFNFGTYNRAVSKVNMLDAKKPLGRAAPKWFLNFRLKEWEAFQAGNRDIFIFGVVYTPKISTLICLVIYDKRNKKLYDYEKIINTKRASIGKGLFNSETKGQIKAYYMRYENNLRKNEIAVEAKMGPHDLPMAILDIKAYHITEPIVICQPFGENRGLYSHKNFMPMEGYLILGDEKIVFNKENSHMIIDDHKGYYPYNMKYDWVTGWGKDNSGNTFAFNLTDNQVLDHEKYNENCIWIDGKMNVLPPIKVERKYENDEVWNIKDEYDMVNISFYPETKTEIKFNYLIVKSDYEAPIGSYKGYFKLGDRKIDIVECFGMGEKKRIRI
ncbi:DUF2804 family protein [Sporanaerobacter acetigenes]|uniref:DUF2804 domain-containing protein n=1 Tax=Sporanaerobacter acetigenes DSM 13106 TaxID=1123281 RepID=A0A1M5WNP6_9FIRM|nr:DUF2804 family protein [Sporanaerobacter acetigenes]SHH88774.1 Protein of unknown function [Sporanaerobacter acetigenes DSM 13106]